MRYSYIILLSLLAIGCTHGGAVQKLGQKYTTFQGVRAAAAELKDGNKALELYIGVGEKEEGEKYADIAEYEPFKTVLWCKAWNEEKDVLVEIAELINMAPADKVIFLYGKKVEGKFRQYHAGLDVEFYAVGIYHVHARHYVYLDAAYGGDWKQGVSWKNFMKILIKQGVKTGVRTVKP